MMNWIFSTSFSIEFGANIQSLFDLVALTNNWLFDKRANIHDISLLRCISYYYTIIIWWRLAHETMFIFPTSLKFVVLAKILFVPSTLCAVTQNTAIIFEKS